MMIGLLLLCAVAAYGQEPPTVDELDIPQYLGLWYQPYASAVILGSFERDGYCVSATYGVFNETVLTVYNHMLIGSPTGPVSDITGYAFATDEAGKLDVTLTGAGFGPYWVMKLGPVNDYAGELLYAYALVSEPSATGLYVLVRDMQEFQDLYEEEALAWLDENGFNGPLNRPLPVYQGSDCLYPSA